MGNQLLTLEDLQKQKSFETYVLRSPELTSQDLLLSGKMCKTYSFTVNGKNKIIMKVFIRRENLDLSTHKSNFNLLLNKLNLDALPNLLPYTKHIEEEDFFAIIRQKIHQTLSERLDAAPCLRSYEKIWIIFQLLTSVHNIHKEGLYHGNIKSSNVLLTTWNHVFLTDFAWHKPYYLFESDLGELNYFFSTSVDRCTLAPEKFVNQGSGGNLAMNSVVKVDSMDKTLLASLQRMDIFSLGCVVAEIMLEGRPLFTYEQLQSFRRGEYYPHEALVRIENEQIRNFVKDAIQKDPKERGNVKTLLQRWCKEIAPLSLPKLIYPLNAALMSSQFKLPDQRVALIREMLPTIYDEVLHSEYIPHYEVLPVNIQNEFHAKRIFLKHIYNLRTKFQDFVPLKRNYEIDYSKQKLPQEKLMFSGNLKEKSIQDLLTELERRQGTLTLSKKRFSGPRKKVKELAIIVAILCANMRSCRYLASKLCVIEILSNFSLFFSESMNLRFMIPYLFTFFDEENQRVLTSAFKAFCRIISTFKTPIKFASEKRIFEDYLLPNIMRIFHHQNVQISKLLIENLHIIIKCSSTFIKERTFNRFKSGRIVVDPGLQQGERLKLYNPVYEAELNIKREGFVRLINDIISKECIEFQETFIENIHNLSEALGPAISEKSLLPMAVKCLQNSRLQSVSFEGITQMVRLMKGSLALASLKPCFERFVTSADEMAAWNGLRGLAEIAKIVPLKPENNKILFEVLSPLILHPNAWIRQSLLELFKNILEKITHDEILSIQAHFIPFLQTNNEALSPLISKASTTKVLNPLDRKSFEEFKETGVLKLKENTPHMQVIQKRFWKYVQYQKENPMNDPKIKEENNSLKKKEEFNFFLLNRKPDLQKEINIEPNTLITDPQGTEAQKLQILTIPETFKRIFGQVTANANTLQNRRAPSIYFKFPRQSSSRHPLCKQIKKIMKILFLFLLFIALGLMTAFVANDYDLTNYVRWGEFLIDGLLAALVSAVFFYNLIQYDARVHRVLKYRQMYIITGILLVISSLSSTGLNIGFEFAHHGRNYFAYAGTKCIIILLNACCYCLYLTYKKRKYKETYPRHIQSKFLDTQAYRDFLAELTSVKKELGQPKHTEQHTIDTLSQLPEEADSRKKSLPCNSNIKDTETKENEPSSNELLLRIVSVRVCFALHCIQILIMLQFMFTMAFYQIISNHITSGSANNTRIFAVAAIYPLIIGLFKQLMFEIERRFKTNVIGSFIEFLSLGMAAIPYRKIFFLVTQYDQAFIIFGIKLAYKIVIYVIYAQVKSRTNFESNFRLFLQKILSKMRNLLNKCLGRKNKSTEISIRSPTNTNTIQFQSISNFLVPPSKQEKLRHFIFRFFLLEFFDIASIIYSSLIMEMLWKSGAGVYFATYTDEMIRRYWRFAGIDLLFEIGTIILVCLSWRLNKEFAGLKWYEAFEKTLRNSKLAFFILSLFVLFSSSFYMIYYGTVIPLNARS